MNSLECIELCLHKKTHNSKHHTTKYGNNLSGWTKACIIMLGYENKETDGHRILTTAYKIKLTQQFGTLYW
jgi:hypothetical protein